MQAATKCHKILERLLDNHHLQQFINIITCFQLKDGVKRDCGYNNITNHSYQLPFTTHNHGLCHFLKSHKMKFEIPLGKARSVVIIYTLHTDNFKSTKIY